MSADIFDCDKTAGRLCGIAALVCCSVLAGPRTEAQSASPLPRVASINLCADQLVLRLADAEQILSVSWLAADPHESMLADRAAAYPLNYGSAEELMRLDPDVVIGGAYTGSFARQLLARLGYQIITIEPAVDAAGIEQNLLTVGAAIAQTARAREAIEAMRRRIESLARSRGERAFDSVLVRPGGFTTGARSLPDAVMRMAGLDNVAASQGLDRWGSLSMETLLRSGPEVLLITDYRADAASLANTVLVHPVLSATGLTSRIVHVPGRYWACGLPESFEAADIILRGVSGSPGRMAVSEPNGGAR